MESPWTLNIKGSDCLIQRIFVADAVSKKINVYEIQRQNGTF